MVILNAFLLSLIAGLATGLGGVVVALLKTISMRTYDTLLGFAAGVMTAVATFGLVQEALDQGGVPIALVGIAAGAGFLFLLDRYLPHEHERLPFVCVGPGMGRRRGHGHGAPWANLAFVCTDPIAYRRGLLLFTALTLHNIPEGLAVGTSYAAAPRLGLLLALAIALHNIPEGMAVAGPFRACGMSRLRATLWALASGLSEPLAALLGVLFVSAFAPLLPVSLAFAGGAMLYVVSDELIPESHSHGYEHQATFGFLVGFLVLVALLQVL